MCVVNVEKDCVAGSCNSPPYFDSTNYAAWKEKFEIFLDALHERAYAYLSKEWRLPVRTVDGESVPKPRIECTEAKASTANCNKKAKNALVIALSSTQFSDIQHIPTAKHAWDKLRVVHEGEEHVERITSEARGLGQAIDELHVVQKILRILPPRFTPKKTAIMEVQNLNQIRIGKLIGKLKTYEMELNLEDIDSKKL
ncbi:unnamed protein product [Prunus armeniaca]